MECLELKTTEMDLAFMFEWGYLADSTDDSLSDVMHAIGYDEDLCYIEFEEYFSHTSLRSQVQTLLDDWLLDSIPDTNNIPDNIVGDIQGQTIMDADGAFYVGDTLYMVRPNGDLYIVTDGDIQTKIDIAEDNWTGSENVVFYPAQEPERAGCRIAADTPSRWSEDLSENYGMKRKVGYYSTGVYSRYYADTDGYYWKNSGWKRYKQQISAEFGAYGRAGSCGASSDYMSDDKEKYNVSDATASQNFWWILIYTKSNEMASIHYTKKCGTRTLDLTWN